MPGLAPASVRGKAVLSAAVVMTLFGLAVGLASYVLVSQVATSSAEAILTARTGDVKEQLGDTQVSGPESVDLGAVEALNTVFVQLVDANGAVLSATPGISAALRLCPATFPTKPAADQMDATVNGTQTTFMREVVPADMAGRPVAICAAISIEPIKRITSTVLILLLLLLPLVIGGVCLAVWLAVGRALRAVDDLRRQAELLEAAPEATLHVQPTGDEVERLGRTLNAMLEKLHQQTRSTRQFVADAGHELRNPLTTLRVSLEFGDGAPADEVRASMEAARADLARLEQLVQDLLALARTDSMETGAHFQEVDLGSMVTAALEGVRRSRPDVDVVADIAPCLVDGDESALRSLTVNLLDNAARHALGTLAVTLGKGGGEAILSVDDDGGGLHAADCERVFHRFVRLDEARVRDEGGSGLGLSIVASVATAHGGTAVALPGPGGHFVVTLPLSQAKAGLTSVR